MTATALQTNDKYDRADDGLYVVLCADDFGKRVVATHQFFTTQQGADAYAATVDASREAQVWHLSTYQKGAIDAIRNGKGSFIVNAKAGSGKTTTILLMLNWTKGRVLFLAFNKDIVTTLSNRVPQGVAAKTFHALCYGALQKHFKGKVKLNDKKVPGILDSMDPPIEEQHHNTVRRLVGLAKAEGLVPEMQDADLTGLGVADDATLLELAEYHGLDMNGETGPVLHATKYVLRMGLRNVNEIDFDDMLYHVVAFDVPLFRNDVIFVDEAQDVSTVQRALLRKALKPGGRLVAVGDAGQAIYAFRGADADSLDRLRREFNASTLPLSICYRCPKAVVREAQRIVPDIECHPEAPEGVVAEKAWDRALFKRGDMVLCRNTKPLITAAYELLGARLPAIVKGRDIGQGLVALLKRYRTADLAANMAKLDAWARRQMEKFAAKKEEDKAERLADKMASLHEIVQQSDATTTSQAIAEINRLFQDPKDPSKVITLSTVHKAKGLEADRVYILAPELMPSKWAVQPHQLQQEYNLQYVAITRAMKELIYLH